MQFLWFDGSLGLLERLSLESFLYHGHTVHVYTYDLDGLQNTPAVSDKFALKDAREILPRESDFNVRGFSDLFRYKLLHEKGKRNLNNWRGVGGVGGHLFKMHFCL
jgi:hypothetical protein